MNTIISYISVVVLVIFVPGSQVYLLIQPEAMLKKKDFQQTWMKAYEDLSLNQRINRFYRLWFCIRRLLFVGSVYLMYGYPAMQLILLMLVNLITTIYQGQFKPLRSMYDNKINMFNEYMVSCVVYLSLTFSSWADTVEEKYFYGWALMLVITLTFLVNMIIIFAVTVKKLYLLMVKMWNLIVDAKERIYYSDQF